MAYQTADPTEVQAPGLCQRLLYCCDILSIHASYEFSSQRHIWLRGSQRSRFHMGWGGEFAGFPSVAPGPCGIEFQFYMKDKDSVLRYSALDSCTAL